MADYQEIRSNVPISATYLIPSGANNYAALDVIADSTSAPTVLTFSGCGRDLAGSGYIVKARMFTDQKTFTGRIKLHLFHTSPTAINDNSPYLLLYANNSKGIGTITFPAAATEDPTNSTAANAFVVPDGISLPMSYKCDANSQALYGIVEVLDIFTSAATQNFWFELTCDQN